MQSSGGPRASDEARSLRRALGPLAWCALEALTERADGPIVGASVRSLAAELGVAKNTAHRALSALTRAGLIAPIQDRAANGRFSAGRYRLHVEHLTRATTTSKTINRPAPRPTQPPTSNTNQPSLFDHQPTNQPHPMTNAHPTNPTHQHDRQVPAGGGRQPCCA